MLEDKAVYVKARVSGSSPGHKQSPYFAQSVELLVPSDQKASLATPLQKGLRRGEPGPLAAV